MASAVFNVPVIPFQFASQTPSQSVAAGQPATFDLSISPVGGNFQQPVTFSCGKLPPHASCAFTPPQVEAGAVHTSIRLSIATMESSPSALTSSSRLLFLAFWVAAAATIVGKPGRWRRLNAYGLCSLALLVSCAGLFISCGGGNGGGGNPPALPPLPASISISPTSASLRTSAAQRFTATMSPANSQVSWDVNGTLGGDSTMGTISSSGLYRAPASLPSVPVVVRVSSQADPSKAAVANVVVQALTPAGAYDVTAVATQGSQTNVASVHLDVK